MRAIRMQAGWVPGTTLLLDLAFPAYPDSMGHWSEALIPVYNVLEGAAWKPPEQATASASFISTLVFVNLRREQLSVRPARPGSGDPLGSGPLLLQTHCHHRHLTIPSQHTLWPPLVHAGTEEAAVTIPCMSMLTRAAHACRWGGLRLPCMHTSAACSSQCEPATPQRPPQAREPGSTGRPACMRAQGVDWVWQMLRLTLAPAVAPGRDLPRILYYAPLAHLDQAAWLGFERALVVQDRRVRSVLIPGGFRAAGSAGDEDMLQKKGLIPMHTAGMVNPSACMQLSVNAVYCFVQAWITFQFFKHLQQCLCTSQVSGLGLLLGVQVRRWRRARRLREPRARRALPGGGLRETRAAAAGHQTRGAAHHHPAHGRGWGGGARHLPCSWLTAPVALTLLSVQSGVRSSPACTREIPHMVVELPCCGHCDMGLSRVAC